MQENEEIPAWLYLDFGAKMVHEGKYEDAMMAFCQAIQINSQAVQAYVNLGLVLLYTDRLNEAEIMLRKAIDLDPHDFQAYNNLGLVFLERHAFKDAEACFRLVLDMNAVCPEAYNNLGLVLEETCCIKEAESAYHKAIQLQPHYADAYYNLGNLLRIRKQLQEAETCFQRTLTICPESTKANAALSWLYLLQEQFDKGWKLFEKYRSRKPNKSNFSYWQGEELRGRSILLFYEYGFGDTIQFIRYAEEVAKLATQIALWVQKPLKSLFQESYPECMIYTDPDEITQPYDFSCSLMSLPVIYEAAEGTFWYRPYLRAAREESAYWGEKLKEIDQGQGYRVGVVWAGNPNNKNDHNRSIPFHVFRRLFDLTEIKWISLQVGPRTADLANDIDKIVDFSTEIVDFSQTAGLIENLDLVIAVDTSVAHLAGAIGKPTWVLLPFDPDWRWFLERQDSPWYPSMRLFRQQNMGDWVEVLERVKLVLSQEKYIR